MATIKSFTDLEQSKKLAEILPLESADMSYLPTHSGDKHHYTPSLMIYSERNKLPYIDEYCIPCWSLAALLGVLPDYTLQTNTDGTVFVVCDSKKPMISDTYSNPVDACAAMIEKLHEQKLL